MMLHMIHSTQHFDECRALLAAADTLLVMDPSVIESEPERFADLPCPVCVLSESSTPAADATVAGGNCPSDFHHGLGATHLPTPSQHGLGMTTLQGMCDDNGFLLDRDKWTPDIAAAFAAEEGIELTDAHWQILGCLRDFHQEFGDSPANRALVNYVKVHVGVEQGNSLYLMGLFPGSPARVGSRIAGLPKPKNCL